MFNRILQTSAIILLFASFTCTAFASMLPIPSEDDNQNYIYQYNEEETDVPPKAILSVRNDSGNYDNLSGTTATVFTFSAYSSTDAETSQHLLEARFDFDNDGNPDTYFSPSKKAEHVYETPGTKTARVEVLDRGGNVSEDFIEIEIVQNTYPHAYFDIEPKVGTPGTEFKLDASQSTDSQYQPNLLKYRFDFNGDGIWDTKFTSTKFYRHKFKNPGLKNVIMEVKDPEKLSSLYRRVVMIEQNNEPIADFEINKIEDGRYEFDASKSYDPNGSKLKYRWDFDYKGYNDIQWNTSTTSSNKGFHTFKLPGEYLIRLMVQDEDKAKSYKILKIIVDIANSVW